jgi:hypothetical protein
MLKRSTFVSTFVTFAALAFLGHAQASQQTNLAGTYRCGPDAKSCEWSGTTFTVNAVGTGTVTSPISVSMGPPWNMLGVVSADGRSIEWSNGTQWRKQ